MKGTVNLFFACDDKYVPLLGVTLHSIKKHADKERVYDIKILNTGIAEEHKTRILEAFLGEKFLIEFPDISREVERIADKLHTRDYYSKSTYYRLFIPTLYPTLSRALYLDCDIVLTSDVGELFDTEIGENLVGTIVDSFVFRVDSLRRYAVSRLGLCDPINYFNAGILLMNLDEMRRFDFERKFIELLSAVKFTVAQDQDYLNVICFGRRREIGCEWNCMPGFTDSTGLSPKLIHYNIDSKPWHKDGVEFANVFWQYSDESPYASEIRMIKESYCDEEKSRRETENLIETSRVEGEDEITNEKLRALYAEIRG